MDLFTEASQALEHLRELFGGCSSAIEAPVAASRFGDDQLVDAIATSAALIRRVEAVRAAATGVLAARSARERGHEGLAQSRGHRSPVTLVQELTGATRADAAKQVRVGEALVTSVVSGPEASAPAWHAGVDAALLEARLTTAQHDAIVTGLGAPVDGGADAWAHAAGRLIDEAALRTVEELGQSARAIRDMLDAEGARERFERRHERRSFRTWVDADGARCASVRFDDAGELWWQAIVDAALRPRRGGPRFVDAEEQKHADALAADPRTNEQLTYDLFLDLLRAGALAEAADVFGARQPGVRIVVTVDEKCAGLDRLSFAAVLAEDGTQAVPPGVAEALLCDVGFTAAALDREGNPLFLGREVRLFSPKQKLALAIRDGGCRWRGCDRPASYCEAHHINRFVADQGRTDIDCGILLCHFHHLALHNQGFWITRDDDGEFVLHSPHGDLPVPMPPRLHLRYAWGDLAPPAKRFRAA